MATNHVDTAGPHRQLLPKGLAALAGLACVAFCAIPWLIAAGILGAAGWAALTRWLPAIVLALFALAGSLWWLTNRRHHRGCAGRAACTCTTSESTPTELNAITDQRLRP